MSPPARPVVVVRCSRGGDPGWAARTAVGEGARLAGLPADRVALTHACPSCGSDAHGRPLLVCQGRVLPVLPSLSRAPGLCVVALAVGVTGVGVDVEELAATGFEGFEDVCLHPHERAATPWERAVVWSRKESLLKATGTGLRVDPRSVLLSGPDQSPQVLACAGLGVPLDRVRILDLAVPVGWAGSLTVLERRRTLSGSVPGVGRLRTPPQVQPPTQAPTGAP